MLGGYYLLFAFPVPVVLALLLNSVRRSALKKFYQTVTLLPHFVSFVYRRGLIGADYSY